MAGQQGAGFIKYLCDRRHIHASIGEKNNDAVVDGVLKHWSSSEAQTYTSGRA